MTNARHDYALEMGWYPDSGPNGRFRVTLIQGGEWEKPRVQSETSDKNEVMQRIEAILREASIAG